MEKLFGHGNNNLMLQINIVTFLDYGIAISKRNALYRRPFIWNIIIILAIFLMSELQY